MVTQENIIDYKNRFFTLTESIGLEAKKMELQELQIRMQDPELWTDTERAQSVNKQAKDIEKFISQYNELDEAIQYLEMMFEENSSDLEEQFTHTTDLLTEMEMYNIFKEEGDNLSCVLTITAGDGGTEAQDWAQMLFRMYNMYCKQNGFKFILSDFSEGKPVGLNSASVTITGEHAYGLLKCETGIHRLVRVSPFNAQGKRMTSFASVFVTPLIDDSINIELDNSKLYFQYFRASGAGGQNVNKVESGVRANYNYTDPDTGETELIQVANTETRDQPKNKENAINILKSILYKKELDRRNKAKKELEDSKADVGWGNQIRSYVLDDSRVKDHRTNIEMRNVDSVLNGNIEPFIKGYLLSKFNE